MSMSKTYSISVERVPNDSNDERLLSLRNISCNQRNMVAYKA